jgi:hypothetical protein
VGRTAAVGHRAAPGGRYKVRGGWRRAIIGEMASAEEEAQWPVLGDGGTHEADRGGALGAWRGGLPTVVGATHWRAEEPSRALVLCEERRVKGVLLSR